MTVRASWPAPRARSPAWPTAWSRWTSRSARRAPPRRPPEARARPAASQSRLLSARRAAAQLGGAGLLALAPLTRLTALTAGQTKVRDGALPMLRGLPALQLLNLASNDITDAGAAGPGARAGAPRSEPGAP